MFRKNDSILETGKSKSNKGSIKDTLIVIGAYIASSIPIYIILIISIFIFLGITDASYGDVQTRVAYNRKYKDILTIISLIGTIISTGILYLLARKYYKRSNLSLGLRKENTFRDYIIGFLLGIGIMFLIVIILDLSDKIDLMKINGELSIGIFILFTIGWILQGFNEELLCRSILMNYYGAKKGILFAIIGNSLLFSFLHIFNSSFSFIPFLNIFLIGVVLSFMFYAFDNIAMASAFHSFWNMAQANIFGIRVSGMPLSQNSIFATLNKGEDIWTGGDFGVEGSLVTSLVLFVMIFIFSIFAKKKSESLNKKDYMEEIKEKYE